MNFVKVLISLKSSSYIHFHSRVIYIGKTWWDVCFLSQDITAYALAILTSCSALLEPKMTQIFIWYTIKNITVSIRKIYVMAIKKSLSHVRGIFLKSHFTQELYLFQLSYFPQWAYLILKVFYSVIFLQDPHWDILF